MTSSETSDTSKFSYSEIATYLQTSRYPDCYTKQEKSALRKRSKYFTVNDGDGDTNLYYIGGGKLG